MLELFYCEDEIFDLPPPSLLYRSDDNGFKSLIDVIKKMIIEQNEVCLNECDFVKVSGTSERVILRPFSNQILLKIIDSNIITDISPDDWMVVINRIKTMIKSKSSLTYFVEFENYIEEGNIVIES